MQRGCTACYRTAFACAVLLKGTHSACVLGPMLGSMRQRTGHVLGKVQALSSESSQAKLEPAAAGGRAWSRQFVTG